MPAVSAGPFVRRRRWPRVILAAAALLAAATAFTIWRPMTVYTGSIRARLWIGGVRDGVTMAGPYQVHYLAAGSGRPVILLHGLGGDALQWGDYLTVFAKDARVLAPDLLGFGTSDQPDVDYSIPLQTEVVRGFLDAVGAEQVDLVGLSMGGWIAADFARRYPARVRRLVLADAGGLVFNPAAVMPFVPRTPADLPRFEQLLGARRPMIPAFAVRDVLRRTERYRWVVERFLQHRKQPRDFLDGRLGSVTMPVLLVWGDRDVLSPVSRAEEFHRQIPQSELVLLSGCGHVAILDCRSEAQEVIHGFLAAGTPAHGGKREIAVD